MSVLAPARLGTLIALVLACVAGLAAPAAHVGPAAPLRHALAPHARPAAAAPRQQGPFAVGIRTLTFVDPTATVRFPGHNPVPRTLVTVIRYPAVGSPSGTDLPDAAPAATAGPFPLVIFGHGFAVTPAPYARLLQAWARAGYVVAAPIFPLENAHAPGGPNESDIVNQPVDISYVISEMVALNIKRAGPFAHLVSPTEIAVSGHSDGGETALVTAYDTDYLDPRVRAAVILSGAAMPDGGLTFRAPAPPLLATQGTADTIDPPFFTHQFFSLAPRPKFLLSLLGAPHLPPYTTEEPQLAIVERVTIDFLNRYLKHAKRALHAMAAAGNVPGVAHLQADP